MLKNSKKSTKDERLASGKLMTKKQVFLSIVVIAITCVLAFIVCLLPTLIADAILLMLIQLFMALILGKIFSQPSILKGLIVAMAATFIGRTLVELIPLLGFAVSAIVGPFVTGIMGWVVAHDLADRSRKEWERRVNAEDAAKAYAEVEYYKKAASVAFIDDDIEAEDFSNEQN